MRPFPNSSFAGREYVFAKLARTIGRGHDAIYHGTRYPEEVLRSGKLIPDITKKISLSRSPEVAVHFACLPGGSEWAWAPAVLVLNRRTLIQVYRLEAWHYGEADEQEEVIRRRTVDFRKHLLGVVAESDVNKVLKGLTAGGQRVREGRARVRDLIAMEREQLNSANTLPGGGPKSTCRLYARQ